MPEEEKGYLGGHKQTEEEKLQAEEELKQQQYEELLIGMFRGGLSPDNQRALTAAIQSIVGKREVTIGAATTTKPSKSLTPEQAKKTSVSETKPVTEQPVTATSTIPTLTSIQQYQKALDDASGFVSGLGGNPEAQVIKVDVSPEEMRAEGLEEAVPAISRTYVTLPMDKLTKENIEKVTELYAKAGIILDKDFIPFMSYNAVLDKLHPGYVNSLGINNPKELFQLAGNIKGRLESARPQELILPDSQYMKQTLARASWLGQNPIGVQGFIKSMPEAYQPYLIPAVIGQVNQPALTKWLYNSENLSKYWQSTEAAIVDANKYAEEQIAAQRMGEEPMTFPGESTIDWDSKKKSLSMEKLASTYGDYLQKAVTGYFAPEMDYSRYEYKDNPEWKAWQEIMYPVNQDDFSSYRPTLMGYGTDVLTHGSPPAGVPVSPRPVKAPEKEWQSLVQKASQARRKVSF